MPTEKFGHLVKLESKALAERRAIERARVNLRMLNLALPPFIICLATPVLIISGLTVLSTTIDRCSEILGGETHCTEAMLSVIDETIENLIEFFANQDAELESELRGIFERLS